MNEQPIQYVGGLSPEDVVLAPGCFDGRAGYHAGHLDFLERASRLGKYLLVALNSDESVRGLKGEGRPILDEYRRLSKLCRLPFVSQVRIFRSEAELAELIRQIRPGILVKGEGSGPTPGQEHAGRVVFLPLVPGISTTLLAAKATP